MSLGCPGKTGRAPRARAVVSLWIELGISLDGACFGWKWQIAAEQAEVVVGPELNDGSTCSPRGQIVALPRPASIEVAHEVSAVSTWPTQGLEGVGGQCADLVDVAVEAGILKPFDHERVEAAGWLRSPLLGEVDVAVQLAGVGIVDVERPEDLELGAWVAGEDVRADGGNVVADGLAQEVGVYVAVHRGVVIRCEKEVEQAALRRLESSRGVGVENAIPDAFGKNHHRTSPNWSRASSPAASISVATSA